MENEQHSFTRVGVSQRCLHRRGHQFRKWSSAIALATAAILSYAQSGLVERPMPAFEAICYLGSGPVSPVDEGIISGLYYEVRNRGQITFSPWIWFTQPLLPPYEFSSPNEWHL